jgi:hypothetical protein
MLLFTGGGKGGFQSFCTFTHVLTEIFQNENVYCSERFLEIHIVQSDTRNFINKLYGASFLRE